jgi:hypothetical protein
MFEDIEIFLHIYAGGLDYKLGNSLIAPPFSFLVVIHICRRAKSNDKENSLSGKPRCLAKTEARFPLHFLIHQINFSSEIYTLKVKALD